MTHAGSLLYDRIEPALNVLETIGAELATNDGRISGLLRLNASRIAATIYLAPILAGFMRDYPDVTVDVVVEDRLIDMVGGGFDAGIRLGEKLQMDMIAVPLSGDLQMKVVGSPAYLARHGTTNSSGGSCRSSLPLLSEPKRQFTLPVGVRERRREAGNPRFRPDYC